MGTQDRLIVDWTKHIPCSRDFVVPTQVRPTFLDYTTFTLATRLGRLAADPANPGPTDYTDLEGGIYYRTTNQRIYYRDALVWRPLGTGDGDVIFDPLGTAQFDDGVARWSTTTREIQGSIATLDDNGNFSTPGYYQSRPSLSTDEVFISRPAGLSQEPRYYVQQDGKTFWGPGGTLAAPGAQVDTDLERLGINELGSTRSDAKFSLTAGDSRIKAQRHLGGLGNAQGNSNYRCPVVVTTIGTYNFAADNVSSIQSANQQIGSSIVLPSKCIQDNDKLEFTVFVQTSSNTVEKDILCEVQNGTADLIAEASIPGSGVYNARITFTITRLTAGSGYIQVEGIYNSGVVPATSNYLYSTSFNWDVDTVTLKLFMRGQLTVAGTYPADSIIVNNGMLLCYNF